MKTSHNLTAFALAAALVSSASAGRAASRLDTINISGGETPLAARAATLDGRPFTVEHEPASPGVAAARASDENPLADRAATLGGEAFTAKRAEGSQYQAASQTGVGIEHVVGNPLAERAATLGGKAFTVEHAAAQPAFLARFN